MSFKKFLLAIIFIPAFAVAQDSIQNSANDTEAIKHNVGKLVTAPVILKSDTLFYLSDVAHSYPVALRAKEISDRLHRLTKNYNTVLDSLHVVNKNDFVEVLYNDELAFITTQNDAKNNGMPILQLTETRMSSLQESLDTIEGLSTKEWFKRLGYFTLTFIVLLGIIKLINWFFRRLNIRLSKIEKTFLRKNQNILKYLIPKKTANIFVFLSNIIRIVTIAIVLFVSAPFMFSFFPWAEHLVNLFYSYIASPVKYVVYGFINFIPSMFFIFIIAFFARYIVRVMREVAKDIELGKLKVNNFHKDWANPTGKIFSLFIYAVSLVMIFPYLPGSGSTAFQGVSIFIGAIISFGSTSAIANIIAGIVITYMRPFQIGDCVKIDNIVGDVIEKTILVTRIRTPKNEDVTIPNANILIGNIVNYTKNEEDSIILHTTITLGYDLPWQVAHKLLLDAANKTHLIEKEPKPFVHQTSLDDYYVSYELNAHTKDSKKMPFIYSEIHKNILEVFNEAGVEILSPAYMAARDGSLTTVPSKLKPQDKSPIHKLVDHLTGRNQKNTITKPDEASDK